MHQQVRKGVSRSGKLRVTNNRSASAAGNAFLQTKHMVTWERNIGYIWICRISGLELFWKGLPGFRIDFCNSWWVTQETTRPPQHILYGILDKPLHKNVVSRSQKKIVKTMSWHAFCAQKTWYMKTRVWSWRGETKAVNKLLTTWISGLRIPWLWGSPILSALYLYPQHVAVPCRTCYETLWSYQVSFAV